MTFVLLSYGLRVTDHTLFSCFTVRPSCSGTRLKVQSHKISRHDSFLFTRCSPRSFLSFSMHARLQPVHHNVPVSSLSCTPSFYQRSQTTTLTMRRRPWRVLCLIWSSTTTMENTQKGRRLVTRCESQLGGCTPLRHVTRGGMCCIM